MARINVEDSLDGDLRFQKLILIFQCPDKALGSVVRAWKVAQRFYLKTGLIPFDEWSSRGCRDELIEVGLAEKRVDGVYMKGSDEQFSWLRQKSNAGKHNRSEAKRTLTDVNEIERETSSSSSSSSFSNSDSISNSISKPIQLRTTGVVPIHRLFIIWNDHCGKLPKAKAMSKKRINQANFLLKTNPLDEYWIDVVKRLTQSNFCNGANDNAWVATFDWFLKPDTHLKALEGAYDNRGVGGKVNRSQQNLMTLKSIRDKLMEDL